MKNKVLTYVVVAILGATVITASVVTYRSKQKSNNNTTNTSQSNESQSPVSEQSLKDKATNSIKSLFRKGGLQCTSPNTTMFFDIKKKRMLVTIETKVDNEKKVSHIVYKDKVTYIWTEGQNTGYKMSQEDMEDSEYAKEYGDFWDAFDSPEKFEEYINKNSGADVQCKN